MNGRRLRLATFAVPLSGNKGSASMLLGLMDSFKGAGHTVEWEVFSYYPERDREIAKGMPGVRIHPGHPKDLAFTLLPAQLLRSVGIRLSTQSGLAADVLRHCDGAMLMGGTVFADSMLYKVPWNVLAALPSWWARCPLVFLSQTIGPLNRWSNRVPARWTLKRAREVHGRGQISAAHASDLGVEKVHYEPDLSFAMEVPAFTSIIKSAPSLERFADQLRTSERKAIGVAPNTIVWKRCQEHGFDYPAFLAAAIEGIDAAGYLPVLIPHSFRTGTQQHHNNDKFLCERVLSQLSQPRSCAFIDADLDPRQLRSLIGELHLLIASRFHSMISALSQEVPPLTFGWGAHKYHEVLDEFGSKDLYHSFKDINPDGFPELLASVLNRHTVFKQRIHERLPAIRTRAQLIAGRIIEALSRD